MAISYFNDYYKILHEIKIFMFNPRIFVLVKVVNKRYFSFIQ